MVFEVIKEAGRGVYVSKSIHFKNSKWFGIKAHPHSDTRNKIKS